MQDSHSTEIQESRIQRDIERIAAFSECAPCVGHSRPTFSPAWEKAVAYIIQEAALVGAVAAFDPFGNVHIRRPGRAGSVWLSGSHLDSVPTGGRFDGVAGVVAPLEVLRCQPQAPLEVIVFAEEEGTTFQRGMLGSQGWTGGLLASDLEQYKNSNGANYLSAGRPFGVDPTRMDSEKLVPSNYCGFVELHIEQGNFLWKRGMAVGLVDRIHGRRQYHVRIEGTANHAGSTRMEDRRDALVGAAGMIEGLEQLAKKLCNQAEHTVITVGRLKVFPNALNVIPGTVEFTLDFRSPSDTTLSAGEEQIKELIEHHCDRRQLAYHWHQTEVIPPLNMDPELCHQASEAAHRLGIPLPRVSSGALHDAAILAPFLPTTMLFVASRDGISHHPEEYSQISDLVQATRILAEMIRR
jgi:allantoate deiminase